MSTPMTAWSLTDQSDLALVTNLIKLQRSQQHGLNPRAVSLSLLNSCLAVLVDLNLRNIVAWCRPKAFTLQRLRQHCKEGVRLLCC
jgi:hypothetical protein